VRIFGDDPPELGDRVHARIDATCASSADGGERVELT
jgi:hypothetical protein